MYEYGFKLDRVVDGDTVDGTIDLGFGICVKKRIRLLGINAPETRLQSKIEDEGKRIAEKEAGLRAKDKLAELLFNKQISIKTELDKTGKFGRVLGTLYTLENECLLNINDFLVIKGYVRKYGT
jgi:micrococcal nuclease